MSETKTALTLVKVGIWLQIPFSIFILAIGGWLLWFLLPVLLDPIFWPTFGWWTMLIFGFIILSGIIGFILAIIWFRWRQNIPDHKTGFLASGIIGMILSGTVPGLLVLIGSVLYDS